MISKDIPSRLMGCLLLVALSLSFGSAQPGQRILSRHARAMMIDMRGFPDTEPFICRGAGFQRNTTDCTQFYRCVDFNNNGKHTIFRFMCGPMAVFDESRSLCTGPELSVPPCPQDQLDAFFVGMKPMSPAITAPATPKPTSAPVTGTTSTTTPVITQVVSTPTPTTTTTTQATVITEVVTVPVTTTTLAPVTQSATTLAPVAEVVTVITTTAAPVTEPATTTPVVEVVTVPVTTTTVAPVTEPATTTTTQAPVTEPVTTTIIVVPVTEPATTTTTQAPVTEPAVVVPVTEPATTTTTQTVVTEATTAITTIEAVTLPATTTTIQTAVTIPAVVVTPGTVSSTESPVVTAAPTTPSTETTTTVKPEIQPIIEGFITIGDSQTSKPITTVINIQSNTIWGVVSQGEGSRIVINEDGSTGTTFSLIPPGAILLINITQDGGTWTDISNQHFTTSTTTTRFPPGTTFSIVQLGTNGQIISSQTILTTKQNSVLNVPVNSLIGMIQLFNKRVVTIGNWSFTTTFVTTGTTTSSFGVLQPSTTTTTATTQTVISTTSTTITGDQQFISGIITVGTTTTDQAQQDLSIPGGDLLAIVPQNGQGVVTLIEEGSTSSTDFNITPGSILAILAPSNSVGVVTNVVQSVFTSPTTTITFPAGSTISILRIGIDGKLVRISFIQMTSSFTLFTSVQSIVGILQTNNFGLVSQIGTGSFATQLIDGSSTPVHVGVINLNPSTTTQVESLTGILQIGDSVFLNGSVTTNLQTFSIQPDVTVAIVVSGEIKITEQDGSFVKQTAVSIPSGGILGIVTLSTGGQITDVANNYFTTTTSQLVFQSGVRFGIIIIRPDGTMDLQNPIDTTVKTTITVPVGSVYGPVTLSSQRLVTGIGAASFFTQFLLIADSNGPNQPATLGNYGVLYFSEQFKLIDATVINSAPVLQQLETISAIVQLGVRNVFDSITSLNIPTGSSFVIIPSGGQGTVTVNEDGNTLTFTILPGQVFGFFNVQDAQVTNIGDGFFTTTTTTIRFGAGTAYGVIRIGSDGQLIPMGVRQTAQNVITIIVTTGSTVGTIQEIDNRIQSIGGNPLAIKVLNNPSGIEFSSFIGILDVSQFTPAELSPPFVPTATPEIITSSSSTESSPQVETTTAAPIEDIKGFITIGGTEIIQSEQQSLSVIDIPSDSTFGVVSQGTGSQITIREEGLIDKSFSIPSGAILMITTTQNGGQLTNVANGLFTSSSTTTTFPAGTTFSIVKLGTSGQIISSETIHTTTTSNSILTIPTKSFVGFVQLFNKKVVSIGGWTFSSTFVTTGTTTSCFGVIQPSTTTGSQTVLTTTSTTITGDQGFISGIITLGGQEDSSLRDLAVPTGNLLAIIPYGGQGTVTLVEEGSNQRSDFTITPGTFFGIVPENGNGIVTNLQQSSVTSTTSTITFPAGCIVSVYRIGVDGKLFRVSFLQITSALTIITNLNSLVGLTQTTSSGVLTNIGSGRFSTQTLTGSSTFFGVLNLNQQVELSQVDSLSGILQVGDATFLQETTLDGETIQIPADSTNAIVTTGNVLVTEEDGSSARQTTISLSAGGIIGLITSAQVGGEITAIHNGYFTTSLTKMTFKSGVTIGIITIRADGTMSLQNPIVTKVKTSVTVPLASTFGQVIVSEKGVVTGIGAASFNTQNLLLVDSTGPEVPAMLGNFGVLYFSQRFQLAQSIVTSSTQISNQLQTISAIIQIGLKKTFNSIDNLSLPDGNSFAIIPVNGQGTVTVNEGGSTSTFTVLPGQIFGLTNIQGSTVTNIGDGFFTTSTTSMSFGAGTTYGVEKIGSDGSIITTEFTRTSQSSFTITVESGSTIGIIQSSGRILSSIGGATFVIRVLSSSSKPAGTVGVLDISGFVSVPTTTTTTSSPAFSTPQPPTSGPFTIDCALNQLHQFPLDCSRFYQCFGEDDSRTVYIFPCAPGLIFDEASSQCLTPSEGVCDDLSSINETTSSSEGVGGFFQINCSGDLYRYPLNCNNFYQCFRNEEGQETIFVFSCAAGLVFDDASSTCRLPAETTSCAVNDNLFRSPSILFQLKQKIDVSSLIISTRTIVQQKILAKSSSSDQATFSLPHQTGRGSTKRKMGYEHETPRQTGTRRIVEEQQTKQIKSTLGNFRPRIFDSGVYGVRIAPRTKSLFGKDN